MPADFSFNLSNVGFIRTSQTVLERQAIDPDLLGMAGPRLDAQLLTGAPTCIY